MSKRRREFHTKELDELQKLRYENKKLKKQISGLRKQMARIDVDRYQNLKDILEKQERLDHEELLAEQRKRVAKKWECHKCQEGFLELHTLPRRDGVYYYRKCTECDNRTKTKPMTEDTEGADEETS